MNKVLFNILAVVIYPIQWLMKILLVINNRSAKMFRTIDGWLNNYSFKVLALACVIWAVIGILVSYIANHIGAQIIYLMGV